MIKSYIKLAFRNLVRNKLTSFINITGLSIAIGCCIFTFLVFNRHFSLDEFHKNAEKIFIAENVISAGGKEQVWENSPVALGPALKKDFPQIVRFVRLNQLWTTVRVGENCFSEAIQFVDDGFFDMFTFPLKYGNINALADPNGVILNESTSIRYFGDVNPVGKNLTLYFNDKPESFVVKGVAKKLPPTASFGFTILANYSRQFNLSLVDPNSWHQFSSATFIQLSDPADIQSVAVEMNRYVKRQNAADLDRPIQKFIFEPLLTMGRNSYNVRQSICGISLTPQHMIPMILGSLFLLLLACFNYVNIGVVAATWRVKEIGIRKVIGGTRSQLVYQFIGEHLMLCIFALLLGIMFAETVILPGFKITFGDFFNLSIIDFIFNPNLWIFLICLLFITAAGAGAYPAFVVSSFQPSYIFRGGQTIKGRRLFTRILLFFQFIFSFYACIGGIVFIQNNIYQNNLDWGYDRNHVIAVPIESKYYSVYKNTIDQNPNIVITAGTGQHIGKSSTQVLVSNMATENKHKCTAVNFDVGFNYLEAIGLRLKNGRSFERNLRSDQDQAVIVNETFVKQLGWQNIVNKKISVKNKSYNVIGVVEDFHYQIFTEKIEPALLRITPETKFNFLIIKLEPGSEQHVSEFLQETWHKLIPSVPYTGFFQDEIFNYYLQMMNMVSIIDVTGSIIFLLITCMGLFGLISLTISKRMKEISIRKVLGASAYNIFRLINKDFIILLIFAAIIALPFSYLILTQILDALIKYNCSVSPLALTLGFLGVMATALLTVSLLVFKAAISNPIDNLRFE